MMEILIGVAGQVLGGGRGRGRSGGSVVSAACLAAGGAGERPPVLAVAAVAGVWSPVPDLRSAQSATKHPVSSFEFAKTSQRRGEGPWRRQAATA